MNNLTLKKILNKQDVAKTNIKTKPNEDFIHPHGNQIIIIFTNQEETTNIRETSLMQTTNLSTKQIKKIWTKILHVTNVERNDTYQNIVKLQEKSMNYNLKKKYSKR